MGTDTFRAEATKAYGLWIDPRWPHSPGPVTAFVEGAKWGFRMASEPNAQMLEALRDADNDLHVLGGRVSGKTHETIRAAILAAEQKEE